jgi:protein involved in temperature-dependent protein secretion
MGGIRKHPATMRLKQSTASNALLPANNIGTNAWNKKSQLNRSGSWQE